MARHTDEHPTAPHSGHGPDHGPEARHETRDVNVRGVVIFIIGLVVACGLSLLAMWALFDYFAAREATRDQPSRPVATGEPQVPPEPRLQTLSGPRLQPGTGLGGSPQQDLAALQRREDELLTTYGWVDEAAGVVRIPIEHAMRLFVERAPATGHPDAPQSTDPDGPAQ